MAWIHISSPVEEILKEKEIMKSKLFVAYFVLQVSPSTTSKLDCRIFVAMLTFPAMETVKSGLERNQDLYYCTWGAEVGVIHMNDTE